jgi:hypothetical protein
MHFIDKISYRSIKNIGERRTLIIAEEKATKSHTHTQASRTIALKKSIRKMHSAAVQGCSRASTSKTAAEREGKREEHFQKQTNKFYIEVEPERRIALQFFTWQHIHKKRRNITL